MTEITCADALPLVLSKDGPRIDSRIVAELLNIQHESLARNVRMHQPRFSELGDTTATWDRQPERRGHPQKYFLFTEAQACFAISISRTSGQKVQVKLAVSRAFDEAKRQVNDFARLFGPAVALLSANDTGRLSA